MSDVSVLESALINSSLLLFFYCLNLASSLLSFESMWSVFYICLAIMSSLFGILHCSAQNCALNLCNCTCIGASGLVSQRTCIHCPQHPFTSNAWTESTKRVSNGKVSYYHSNGCSLSTLCSINSYTLNVHFWLFYYALVTCLLFYNTNCYC